MQQRSRDQSLIKKFGFAFSGIGKAFKKERNLRYHTLAVFCVVAVSFFLHISRMDWTILILLMALVVTAELFNTAIERVVDLVTLDEHPLAKEAKDIAAGAVVVTAIAAVIIGILILSKYI
ncbi:diacylglycerol kinase [Pullulanibacillus camelliae]|uniref:Diacylglycerol kinase n=1 Tax=Pullulanibacillus camelliae TaxID=1707096 RepID=A0A8J3DWV4_9BACL|nr:diacylglycerol kinase family protein [Pullulanibacillus camelliae]GGE47134.1 diacylglycerol kinase [Pullulanibacillus camelliae]